MARHQKINVLFRNIQYYILLPFRAITWQMRLAIDAIKLLIVVTGTE